MPDEAATRRLRRMEQFRRAAAYTLHLGRRAVTPALRRDRSHSTIISTATYSPWTVHGPFVTTLSSVKDHTLLDDMRLHELWQLSSQVAELPGHGIEVGCWRGGAGCLIAERLAAGQPGTKMFLCDTFTGVVKAGDQDSVYQGGEHADADAQDVLALASRMGLSNVEILPGIFPDESSQHVADEVFKFAHIDVDVYEGSRGAFEWIQARLVRGGIIVLDDYGSSATDGVRKFVDELQGHPDFVVVHNLNGQAVVVRRNDSGSRAATTSNTPSQIVRDQG